MNAAEKNRGLFLSLASVLVGFGVIMVHSASITSRPSEFESIYLSRHVLFLLVGVTAAAACSMMSPTFWRRISPLLYLAAVGLLVAVLVPGIGTRVNGAQRWLRYGGFSMQPSEIAKIALPLLTCRILTARPDRLKHWFWGTVPVLIPAALMVPLVVLQPDLGTALFLVAGCGIALFAGGWPIRNFIVGISAGVPAAFYLLAMKPYQVKRITGFLETWIDVNAAPYQLKQSLLSLGTGGLSGVGLGKGWQKLSYLPEANTDFVFAVVGEELGLIGTLALIATWIGLYVAGLRLLLRLPRGEFASVAGFTLLTQLILQAALNVAVVTAMVPPKGIPHPLVSYGGSNLVVSLIAIGIVVSLSRTHPQPGEQR